jgi:hypothetical protein
MSLHRVSAGPALLALFLVSCDSDSVTPSPVQPGGALQTQESSGTGGGSRVATASPTVASASGKYRFFIPFNYNNGIFGIEVHNRVTFTARKNASGEVFGRFHYVQTAGEQDFRFSGKVTCLVVYDTPVLQNFPEIPAQTGNRSKWGGLIEESNDPTLPAGGYIWFSSIDNQGSGFADLSTLSGFGDQAANEAFCNSPNPPNPNFGPHLVTTGDVVVR